MKNCCYLLIVLLFALFQCHESFSNASAATIAAVVPPPPQMLLQSEDSVLIVGAASFLGFHVVQQLIASGFPKRQILAIDKFSVDVDTPAIDKYQRAAYLQSHLDVNVTRDSGEDRRSSSGSRCIIPALDEVLRNGHSMIPISHVLYFEDFTHAWHVSQPIQFSKLEKDIAYCLRELQSRLLSVTDAVGVPAHFIFKLPALTALQQKVTRSPVSAYSLQKEEAVLHHHLQEVCRDTIKVHKGMRGFTAHGLRFATIYGPWDDSTGAVSAETNEVLRYGATQSPFAIAGPAQYLHVEDAAAAIVSLMAFVAREMATGVKLLHVGPSSNDSMTHMLDTVELHELILQSAAAVSGEKMPAKPVLSNDAAMGMGDVHQEHHLQEIGNFLSKGAPRVWTPRIEIHDGIANFVEWFREHESRVMPCASECIEDSHQSVGPGLCFSSAWDTVALTTQRLTAGCANVFYTVAIDSHADDIHELPKYWDDGSLRENAALHCNIAFVARQCPLTEQQLQLQALPQDTAHFEYKNWTVVLVGNFTAFADHRKPTRVPKLSPSKFFAESVHYAVYMDSKLLITCDPRDYIAMMSSHHPDNRGNSLALLAVRISEHEEGIFYHIDHVLERLAERPSITYYPEELEHQGRIFKATEKLFGVRFLNLFDGAFMVHRLHSEAAMNFRCDWYREYQQWSDRDQVAASYVLTMRAHDANSDAAVTRKEYIPVGQDKGGTHFVRLLPHDEYHWTENIGRIGQEKLFTWNRQDETGVFVSPEVRLELTRLRTINSAYRVEAHQLRKDVRMDDKLTLRLAEVIGVLILLLIFFNCCNGSHLLMRFRTSNYSKR